MTWSFVLVSLAIGGLFVALGQLRARARADVPEALPECRIGELEPGRFRVRGRVIPLDTSRSEVDGADCVYLEHATYRSFGTGFSPLLREVEHGARTHAFYLEDDTGRLMVDPASTIIDCATATADGGLTVERRLRAGEEVFLVASFEPVDEDGAGQGPYRAESRRWRPVWDETGPPRLSHRTMRRMIPTPPDQVTAFLGGVGGMMIFLGGLLAFVITFVA